jgi:hypothetical protein
MTESPACRDDIRLPEALSAQIDFTTEDIDMP